MKKFLSIGLAFSLTLSMSFNIFAASFNDVSGHWAESQITNAADMGIVSGDTYGGFRPNDYITRAEMVTIVNKAFGYSEEGDISFSDVKSGDWFYSQIAIASEAGYISGDAAGTMRPRDSIVRQEAAIVFAKVLNLDLNTAAASVFADSSDIASWAVGYVGAVADKNIMTGRPGNLVVPKDKITRAETVSMVLRALDYAAGIGEETPVVSATAAPTATPAPTANPETTVIIEESTYGPTTGSETIEKNVLVKNSSVIKNLKIKGDLTVDAKNVTLQNVSVDGTLYIIESGAYVSVNSALNSVVIDESSVRLNVSGNAKISKLTVTKNGENSTITLNSGSTIELFTAEEQCTVNGSGTVTEGNLKVSNVTMTNEPTSYAAGSHKAQKPTTSSSGGSNGSGSTSTPTPSPATPSPTLAPEEAKQAVEDLINNNVITVDSTSGTVVVENKTELAKTLDKLASSSTITATVNTAPAYTEAYANIYEEAVNNNTTIKSLLTSNEEKTATQALLMANSSAVLVNVVNETADKLAVVLNTTGNINSAEALQEMTDFYRNEFKAETSKVGDSALANELNTIARDYTFSEISNKTAELNSLVAQGTVTAAQVMALLFGQA